MTLEHMHIHAQTRDPQTSSSPRFAETTPLSPLAKAQQSARWYKPYLLLDYIDGGRSWKGVDCWGLVWLPYKEELGIILPSYDEVSPTDRSQISALVAENSLSYPWVEVPIHEMQPFDVVIFRGLSKVDEGRGRGYAWLDSHVGIVTIPPFVMHTEFDRGMGHVPLMNTTEGRQDDLMRRRLRKVCRYSHV